ncbi:MAG: hypothetical protein R8G33_02580 [Gammaproteobacteria bacterium]|nr:hypothetical protein [Gammaproteobacteria bacterium]
MKIFLIAILILIPTLVSGHESAFFEKQTELWEQLSSMPPYPSRKDGPSYSVKDKLRYVNISDEEVRQIQAKALELNPGMTVNIGGVTVGCPCEDGPNCKDQVWVVTSTSVNSIGLMYSKIDGSWVIGPVQSWWMQYEMLFGKIDSPKSWGKSIDWYKQNEDSLTKLYDSKPSCLSDNTDSIE